MSDLLKRIALLALLQAGAFAHASDVHVGVSIHGEVTPGVYGRVDIGNARPPAVIYQQPVVIVQERRHAAPRPIYMHVPPGHAKNWGKHCHKYNACAQPVYFVKSAEYRDHKGKHKKHKHDHHDRHHDRHDHHHDRHDDRRGHRHH